MSASHLDLGQWFQVAPKMKSSSSILLAALLWFAPSVLFSQQINWGSSIYDDIVDSEAQVLDQTFIFQLGAFSDGFTPDSDNVSEWVGNWEVYDQADYNGIETPVDDGIWGYFTSTVNMEADGTSNSPDLTPGASSFEGRSAFVWIRNGDDPVEGTEWLLMRADAWIFPAVDPDCCDNTLPLEWSMSDLLVGDVPLWGSQGGTMGDGEYTTTGSYTMQTFTFVPEPSTALLCAMAGLLAAVRRRREP